MAIGNRLVLLLVAGLVAGCTAEQPSEAPPTPAPDPLPVATAEAPPPEAPAESDGPASNVFHSATTGFSITKPDQWFFLAVETPLKNQDRERLDDAALDEETGQLSTAPVVTVAQFDTPQDTFVPRVEVMLRPLGYMSDLSAVEVLEVFKPAMTKDLRDFSITENITEVFVGGGLGAELTVTHTRTGTDGQEFPVETRVIGVKRGKFLFQIAASISTEEQGLPRELLTSIVDSIQIERP